MIKSTVTEHFSQVYVGDTANIFTRAMHAVTGLFAALLCALQSPGGF